MSLIHSIRLGTGSAHLIQGRKGYVLVDAGNRGHEKRFLQCLNRLDVNPGNINLVVITHAHFDHVGSLAAIQRICKCPVAVHELERDLLEQGRVVLPEGTMALGKAATYLGRKLKPGFLNFDAVRPDILISGPYPLDDFGLPGAVIHPTPGHTAGSVSLVLKTGQAFVGDMAVNMLGRILPPFANDIPRLYKTWKEMLDRNPATIYVAHGPAFPASRLEQELQRRNG
jgi:hydroxyacylglutathione hydrolase